MSDENELKRQHLLQREEAVTKMLEASIKLKKSPQDIYVLKEELRDIQDEEQKLIKKDQIENEFRGVLL